MFVQLERNACSPRGLDRVCDLREVRRRAGISQRTGLADRVSPSTVARIERDRMEPTFDMLNRLVEACGCELRIRIAEARTVADAELSSLVRARRPGAQPAGRSGATADSVSRASSNATRPAATSRR